MTAAELQGDALSSISRLFETLDGRWLSVLSRRWRIEVYGVFQQEGSYWLQLALRGRPDHMIAVKCDQRDSDIDVVEALTLWLANPLQTTGRVVVSGW